MTATPAPSTKTPWHLWVVGVMALLWNAVGALDFTMTQLHSEAYLKDFTAEQKTYFFGLPFWEVLAWGIATWGSLVASLLLLLRRSLACPAFAAALAGALITFGYSYGIADGLKVMGDQATGALIFCGVIIVIAILLLLYARAMRQRGVLR
jgi:hypothetical protein